ncbi:protein-tyrosine sulfotransferase-like protein isoform X3 [Tanacetum coccineum]|uniref:Protein-tyrosine sulfotransferase-like protein isoform X3 n=1 Tax=Tanacetum coccineum TaxID=301880 RepID=A0ABQ5AW90_9ASTR
MRSLPSKKSLPKGRSYQKDVRKGRLKNEMRRSYRNVSWTVVEEIALCKGWIRTSEDSDNVYPSTSASNFEHCETTVKQWASSSLHSDTKDGHILKDFFLKKLYSSSLECPRSYDKLRFDPRSCSCAANVIVGYWQLMMTIALCPNCLERESSVQQKHQNCAFNEGCDKHLDIWPWKYLVPWMMEDLFARRDARKRMGPPNAYGNDSYNMEEIVMPLHEFINHPVALDIIHNGATFQVAGLTNNSNIWEMHEVRHCVMTHQTLGKYVLDVAKASLKSSNSACPKLKAPSLVRFVFLMAILSLKRLDAMLYVGLTEDHRESATMFANLVGAQVISQFGALNAVTESEQGPFSKAGSGTSGDQDNNTWPNEAPTYVENMTVGKLMETYETCVTKLRSTQSKRRVNSMRRISPTNFTKEARLHVSEPVLKQIALMNSLDVELYKHAQKIFGRQHQVIDQNPLNSTMPDKWQMMHGKRLSYMGSAWEILYLGFAMESQDQRICKTEPGVTVDYNHRVYDEDCFGDIDILNLFDFPMESLEGDGLAEDWASKLGPIPSEVLGSQIGVGNNFGPSTDLPFEYPVLNNRTSQLKYSQNHYEETPQHYQSVRVPQLKQEPMFVEDKKLYPSQASPNSVLESRSSSSNSSKGISFGIEISIPVRTRSKRLRPTTNPWLLSPITMFPNKDKKRKKPTQRPFIMETKTSEEMSDDVGVKKCAHCEITKTPQWREGPTGPKTLCNACGVRYRSGRLYPEYRPAASPTFVPALHSNSHRKVIEMRQKAYYK